LAFAVATAGASAFTLDFAPLTNEAPVAEEPARLVLTVLGYGNLGFASATRVDESFTSGEALVVSFSGNAPADVGTGLEPVSLGEALSGAGSLPPERLVVTFTVSGPPSAGNAGESAVIFIPEPSTLLLGALGMLLVLRRRRE
jgi:hypothetical protein